jgi:hypothetical protein
MSFIDVADVKARCSIEQATKSLGLKCTEIQRRRFRRQKRSTTPSALNIQHRV